MNLLIKVCAAALLLISTNVCQAQYANGTGTGLNQDQIFWLEWGGPALTTTPAGFTATNVVAGTYIWDLEPGLVRIVGQLSNIENPVAPTSGTLTLTPYNSGTWAGNGTTSLGDGLQLMYPGVNPVGIATRLTGGTNTPYSGGVIEFDISLQLQILENGVWTNVDYPGMVVADAESMTSTGAGTEYISADTDGAGWQILDVRNDAASIGQDPTKYMLDITNGGSSFRLRNDQITDMGVQAVMFAQGATSLTNVQMRGRGVTALALGFVAPFDYGDAPASYGEVFHYIDELNLSGTPITTDGSYSVVNQTISSLTPSSDVYINTPPDADGGLNHFSENADIDGATTIPNYDGSGTYTLTIPITNSTGLPTNVGAWIDWNQNGVFDASEAVMQTNPASATSATFTWTGLTTAPDPSVNYYVRVRATTDVLTGPTGGATDGEVEDYFLNAAVVISGNVFNDANGLTNGTVDGTGTNVGGTLFVNLVDGSGNVVASVAVGSDGTYEFGGALSGNYTVQLSANQGVAGSPAPAAVLPIGWVSTGENLGAGAGNDGAVNTILPITVTPGTPVTDANFGIEQPPVSDDKNHTISQPVIGSSLSLNGSGALNSPGPLTATDPEEGILSTGKTVTITDLSEMDGNELYYNGVLVTAGTIITNYDPSLLSIKFTGVGSTSADFEFAFSDAAGQSGQTGNYHIDWSTPLPVTLISFTAKKEVGISVLNWETASETNSDLFLVQRSADAKSWQNLGSVKAQGESNVLAKYFFHDNAPLSGTNFYRLKMVDRGADGKDGSFAYSRIRELDFGGVSINVYPNPVSGTLHISETVAGTLKDAAIFNVKGQKVFQSTGVGSQQTSVQSWVPGIYLIKMVKTDGSVSSHKIVISH